MCKFVAAHTRQSPFSGDLARNFLKLPAWMRRQWWFSFNEFGPLLTQPPKAPCGTSVACEHPLSPGSRHILRLLHPGRVTQELPSLLRPFSLNKRSRRMIRHPGQTGYIGYFLLTLSQCYITTLFPPSSRFSCVSTSFFPVCCHWLSFFILPSFLIF